jgi:4'-phosphopantetheinyl transferase
MDPKAPWPLASAAPLLEADEVHVWRILLDLPAARVESLRGTLSADELARAARYRFEGDRRRYTVARGVLRAILGSYAGVPAPALRFLYGPHGKPRLAEETGGARLRFNLAHSQDRALSAVALERQVGVDLERITPDIEDDLVAGHLFSPSEIAALHAAPPEARAATFYRLWTQKEAWVKATGDGLRQPLDAFEVTMAPGEAPRLRGVGTSPADACRWSLHDLHPWTGHAAALAVEGHGIRIRCYEWSAEAHGSLPDAE